jgi:hypothetical protein
LESARLPALSFLLIDDQPPMMTLSLGNRVLLVFFKVVKTKHAHTSC